MSDKKENIKIDYDALLKKNVQKQKAIKEQTSIKK
jgi:hypothetical protein